MNPALELLLSAVYVGALAPEHRADLEASGLIPETIRASGIRSVPPNLIDRLLGFPTPKVTSAYIIPFPDPRGGWFDHIRLKVFPSYTDREGRTVKYLGPRGAPPRLYCPRPALPGILDPAVTLTFVEGIKKALAACQHGAAVVAFEGIQAWHAKGTRELLPDFVLIPLSGRRVGVIPDGDGATNPDVRLGADQLARVLYRAGAVVSLAWLPAKLP